MTKIREIIVDANPPESKDVVWVDTNETEPVQKIYINGSWKKISDPGSGTTNYNNLTNKPKIGNREIKGNWSISYYGGQESVVGVTHNMDQMFSVTFSREDPLIKNTFNVFDYNHSYHYVSRLEFNGQGSIPSPDQNTISIVMFDSGNTPTELVFNDLTLQWVGGEPMIEANKRYLLSFWNGFASCAETTEVEYPAVLTVVSVRPTKMEEGTPVVVTLTETPPAEMRMAIVGATEQADAESVVENILPLVGENYEEIKEAFRDNAAFTDGGNLSASVAFESVPMDGDTIFYVLTVYVDGSNKVESIDVLWSV